MINVQSSLAGWYKIEAIRPDGSKRLLADWFPNLILDAGLERMGVGTWLGWCSVGSNNTPPNVAQTALLGYIATTNSLFADVLTAQSTPPYYGSRTRTYRFAVGAAAGNLSEVGVGWGSNTLFSRALILDGAGNPTTITVLADEVLDVTYELRLYPPLVDTVNTVVISGVSYTVTGRASLVTNAQAWAAGLAGNKVVAADSSGGAVYSGPIGVITAGPSGSIAGINPGGYTNAAYIANSKYIDGTWSYDLTHGNAPGGIRSMASMSTNGGIGILGAFQFEFSPVIPKDNTKVMTLTFRSSWARYP